jgi:PAS domain S-box-containing protein
MTTTQSSSHHRILVIDDTLAIHEDFQKILGGSKLKQLNLNAAHSALFDEAETSPADATFQIDSAYQGREGLELLRKALADGRPYSMAFVDVRMPPGWDGIETISHLWKDAPDLQVVICTAYADYSWDEIRRVLGETDNLLILKKPFDNIEVIQLAHTMTRKWLLSRQAHMRLDELERRVAERTSELRESNKKLQKEIVGRKLIEEALRASEERFAKAFRSSPIPVAIQSLDTGLFVDANDSFLLMTGLSREETISPHTSAIQVYADPLAYQRMISELSLQKTILNRQCALRTKAGQERQALVSMEVIAIACAPHAIMIAQDITDRLSLESQLRQAQKMEAVGQLAAGVAHDFNNILTIIQGHSSLLLNIGSMGLEVTESLQEIASSAKRAASLTSQLLAFSRKQIIQPRDLDLNSLVRNLHKMLTRLIGGNIVLECDYHPEPLPVRVDVTCLEQVLVNLAVNARDAMPNGGFLRIQTSAVFLDKTAPDRNPEARPGPFARVSVSDTGCGMSADTLKRIFEPFFTTKEVGKGSGLGLATVHGILHQHDSWIEVQSYANHGSTFTFFLALTGRQAVPDPVQPPPAEREPGRRARILIVEDERSLRNLVSVVLKRHGYVVVVAENGDAALKLWEAQQGRFDLLFSDMMMPGGISGRALADTFRAANPGIKIIYSSGYSIELAEEDAIKRDKAFFLPKPYDVDQLLNIIHRCLDSP